MRIVQSGTFEVSAGGVATCVYSMLLSLNRLGINAELFAYEPENNAKIIGSEVNAHYTKKPIRAKWNKLQYSPDYKKDLINLGEVDVYHANGIWLYDTYAMIDVAKKQGRPYVLMPHGMLYPQDIMKSNKRMKQLFMNVRLRRDFNRAACVLATCTEEMKHCREIGITAPIAVVPNSIDVVQYPEKKFSKEGFVLGYIGRVSRRKNIEGLIYAWANLGTMCSKAEAEKYFDTSTLLIIGGGDDDYMGFLHNEVKRLHLKNVKFTGFLSGKEKDNELYKIDVLCLPSEFENFGMVITEGLVRGIPCIATKGAPWEDLNIWNCGWWIEYSQNAINTAVHNAFFASKEKLCEMGKNGIKLMHEKYSLDVTGVQLNKIYKWILCKEDKPEYVYCLEE